MILLELRPGVPSCPEVLAMEVPSSLWTLQIYAETGLVEWTPVTT